MASLDFIPERTMWVGANTATVAIVDGGGTRTLASLRGHCVCYWWAAGDYGYSQRLSAVYGSEGRCCEDKDPMCEYTTMPSEFMFISKGILSLCMEIYALLPQSTGVLTGKLDFRLSLKVVYLPLEQAKRGLVKKPLIHTLPFQDLLYLWLKLYFLYHLRSPHCFEKQCQQKLKLVLKWLNSFSELRHHNTTLTLQMVLEIF